MHRKWVINEVARYGVLNKKFVFLFHIFVYFSTLGGGTVYKFLVY